MKAIRYFSKGIKRASRLRQQLTYKFHVPPGHFYSPIVSPAFVRQYGRQQLRREIQAVQYQLFHQPQHRSFCQSIRQLFSKS